MIRSGKKESKKENKQTVAKNFSKFTNQMAATVLRGIKMASPSLTDPNISIMEALEVLKSLGVQALAWKPETLFSVLDKETDASEALLRFHETGTLHTKIPDINRQKIYALRIIMTSDTAHREWHIFEKVGSVFNGRLAHFGVVEPLDPIECARTVAIINSIRPDMFSEEIISYVAASCHLDGLYTIAPCKWLNFADQKLQELNKEKTGRSLDLNIANKISDRLTVITNGKEQPAEDFCDIQALKLLALNTAGDSVVGKG